jgi:hypothetical protein
LLATDTWLESVDWRSYVYKEKPKLAAHAQEVARQAAATQQPEANNGDYLPGTESKTAQNLVLETNRGTVVDFLDQLEKQIILHILHRNLVSSEHWSKKDYERNSRPWTINQDVDFLENGKIENHDKVQSEYWSTHVYSLFMSICSFFW